MTKVHASVSIDEDILKKAQQSDLNVSGEVEAALRKKFISTSTDIPKETGEKCEFCNRKFPKQTADDVRNNTSERTLIWLCPDEVWCCESCLHSLRRIITKVAQ